MTARIVAMGGGGFAMDPLGAPTNLDRYLVELTGKASPLVCFAPTASADDPTYINKFLTAYGTLGVRPMVLTLWTGAAAAVARLAEADLVFVGNGGVANMYALWKAHGVHKALKARYERGDVVFAGTGAGAQIWFEGSVTDSFGDYRAFPKGLGLLPGSFCSHFDRPGDRGPTYTEAVANGDLDAGWAADDGAGVVFADGKVERFVTETPGKHVYRVEASDLPSTSGLVVQPAEKIDQL